MNSKWTWISAGVLLPGLVVAVILQLPGNLEGTWHNQIYVNCMCDSRNFLLFEDGDISFYSDGHESRLNIGTYRALGDGKYEVNYSNSSGTKKSWVVTPKLLWWTPPADPSLPPRMNQWRSFYRPLNRSKDLEIISSASHL